MSKPSSRKQDGTIKVTAPGPDGTMGNEVELGINHPGELVIRTGAALPAREPVCVKIHGDIGTVSQFLATRAKVFSESLQLRSHVIVEKEEGSVALFVDEINPFGSSIGGEVTFSSDLVLLPINTGSTISPVALADKIKFNYDLFDSRETAMRLVSTFRRLHTKVKVDIEKMIDERGNSNMAREEAIQSNIPESFAVHLAIARGEPRREFIVDVCVRPDNLEVYLKSPDLFVAKRTFRDEAVDKEVARIIRIAPRLVVVYR